MNSHPPPLSHIMICKQYINNNFSQILKYSFWNNILLSKKSLIYVSVLVCLYDCCILYDNYNEIFISYRTMVPKWHTGTVNDMLRWTFPNPSECCFRGPKNGSDHGAWQSSSEADLSVHFRLFLHSISLYRAVRPDICRHMTAWSSEWGSQTATMTYWRSLRMT